MSDNLATKGTEDLVPDWATEAFNRFHNHVEQSSRLLGLAANGISVLVRLPDLDDILAKGEADEGEEKKERREQRREVAALAKAEVDQGFPLLHSQAVVSLWSELEDCIRTFLARWLANQPGAKEVDAVSKLRITLGDYEALDEDEPCFYITELLRKGQTITTQVRGVPI